MSHTPEEIAASLLYQDELTGCPNRRYLQHYLKDKVDWAGTTPLAALLIDLDFFQKVNDVYGYAVGDDVLLQITKRLRAAAPGAVVTRYGGDAFLLLLPGQTSVAAATVSDRVRAALAADPLATPKDRLKIALTLSAGAAAFPADAKTGDGLIDAVTRAVYVSKKAGRNRTAIAGQLDLDLLAEQDSLATLPCPAFVGRKVELDSAMALLDELRARRPSLLFVQGDGGCGKSRFLREYADRSKAAGILYLYVGCSEEHRQTPAFALLHLIDRFYASRPDEQAHLRSKLSAPQRALIRDLVPAFGVWKTEGIVPAARERKLLTLQAVEAAIVAMTDKAPLLILMDNAAFADRGTLDILRIILRDRKAAIGVLFAFKGDVRAVDRARDPAWSDFVQEFEKQQRMDVLSLAPLQRAQLLEMIAAILPGAVLPDGFAETLIAASKGSPLYIEEAIRALALQGRVRKTAAGWNVQSIEVADMAGSLDALIQSMLDRLPEGTGEVITNAAVVGTQFDVGTLQEVMGKREAAMYDAMDRTRATGLIRRDREGGAESFEFTADHTRTVRYASTPDDVRKTIHNRVTAVLRVRNLDKPELGLSQIAYHESRSRGEEPPAETDEVEASKPSRQARIPETAAPLSVDAMRRSVDMMRALVGLLKVGRLYPQWSQTADSFRAGLQTSAAALLADAPLITFAITPAGLRLNGLPPDSAHAPDAVAEVERLLADRLVGSLTIQAGLEPRELQALTTALAAPMDKNTAPADFWDRMLDREEIKNFDVLQKRYISRAGDAMQLRGRLLEERPLTPEELDLLWTAVRFLKAGVDNLRMYPPGHTLVEGAMADATASWQDLLGRVQQITLSAPEGVLIVNSTAVDPKTAGDATALIASEIKKKDFKSITLERGLDADEVRGLVSILTVPDAKTAKVILATGELRHIGIGARTYQRVATGDAAVEVADAVLGGGKHDDTRAGMANAPSAESIAALPASRVDLRARAWLIASADKFVSDVAEREFAPLVEALNYGAFADLAIKMIDRLGRRLAERPPALRRRAVVMIARAIGEAVGEARALVMTRLRKPLQSCLLKETDIEVLRALAATSFTFIHKGIQESRLNLAADFCVEALKAKMESPDSPREFKALMTTRFQGMGDVIGPMLQAIRNGPSNQREAAQRLSGLIGAPLIRDLVKIVVENDNPEARRAAASALREVGGAGQADLAREIRADASVETARRVLGVLELAGGGSVATAALTALAHRNGEVREAGFGLIRRIERAMAAAILRKTLAMERDIALQGLLAARELLLHDLVPDVMKIAMATEEDDLARSACFFLSECSNPVVVPALRRVFEQRVKMFGLVKGFSDATRAAAILAASKIPVASARDLITEARSDRSEVVRRAAK